MVSFAEFIKRNSLELVLDNDDPSYSSDYPSTRNNEYGYYLAKLDLRVWVEEQKKELELRQNVLEKKILKLHGNKKQSMFIAEVNSVIGKIMFCEELLEGLK
jgi:hypothetical protein